MEITYSRNKMSAKMCDINNFEYLQKLIYTEIRPTQVVCSYPLTR